MSASKGFSLLHSFGAGILLIIASITWSIFFPVLADIKIASLASIPITFSISSFTLSGSEAGRSILLIIGTISKLCSSAKYTLANVWAWIPCVASTNKSAPSQAAKLLLTS